MALAPVPALAEVCDKINPSWPGGVSSMIWLGSLALAPLLVALTLRRSFTWTIAFALSILVLGLALFDLISSANEIQQAAHQEGCRDPQWVFPIFAVTLTLASMRGWWRSGRRGPRNRQ